MKSKPIKFKNINEVLVAIQTEFYVTEKRK